MTTTTSFLLALAGCLVLFGAFPAAAGGPRMYILSDVHYDPYYGLSDGVGGCTNPFSGTGCDSSHTLLTSALTDFFARAAVDTDGVYLYLGDVVRHKMADFTDSNASTSNGKLKPEYNIVAKIAETVWQAIKNASSAAGLSQLPANFAVHPNFMTVLGNEDCVPDYYYNESSTYHPALTSLTKGLVDSGMLGAEEAALFGRCAFYSRVFPGTNLRVVALNTVLYSIQHGPDTQLGADPCGQFVWLSKELAAARAAGHRVHIIGHVVPYAVKWYRQYQESYATILAKYADVVSVQWFAHTHMFSYVAIAQDNTAPPGFLAPSITPRDGNNPSYISVDFTDQPDASSSRTTSKWLVNQIHHRFINVGSAGQTAQWLDGQTFPGPEFPDMPQQVNNANLFSFGSTLLPMSKHATEWKSFQQLHQGGIISFHMGNHKKRKLLCRMTFFRLKAYQDCVDNNNL